MVLPLQAGGTGGIELLIVLAIALVVPLVVSAYIYRDAKGRNSSHALAWAAAAFVGNWIVWILYYVVRNEVGAGGRSASSGL